MKKRAIFITWAGILLLATGVLLWRVIVEWRLIGGRRLTREAIHFVEQESQKSADFVVYRAYKDAASEIKSGTLYFSSVDGWERSFQVGSLKVVTDPVPPPHHEVQARPFTLATRTPAAKPPPSQATGFDWHAVYNWHKSRAAFRQLQQSSTPSAGAELLDGLEHARVLTHPERLGVESTNVVDPY